MIIKKSIINLSKAAILSSTIIILSACEIAPPKADIAYAEATLLSAKNTGATEYAGVEFDEAQKKIQQAKIEMDAGNNTIALRLAKESLAVANLAKSKSKANKALVTGKQLKASFN